MQRHDVGLAQERVQADVHDAGGPILGRQLHIGIGDQHPRAERPQQLHHARADRAIAHDPDRHFGEFPARTIGAVEVSAPLAAAQRFVPGPDQPRLAEDRPDRELGHRAGVAARHVDHS